VVARDYGELDRETGEMNHFRKRRIMGAAVGSRSRILLPVSGLIVVVILFMYLTLTVVEHTETVDDSYGAVPVPSTKKAIADRFKLGKSYRNLNQLSTFRSTLSLAAERGDYKFLNVKAPMPRSTDALAFTRELREAQVALLVMSARHNFEARQLIRETWAKGHDMIWFVIGGKYCEIPPAFQAFDDPCKLNLTASQGETSFPQYIKEQEEISRNLTYEINTHKDILYIENIYDSYGNLAEKVKEALFWADRVLPRDVTFFTKVDDDCIVNVGRLRRRFAHLAILQRVWRQRWRTGMRHYVMGSIWGGLTVLKSGKWMEPNYHKELYPPYPNGAGGYLVHRALVQKLKLFYEPRKLQTYRCEDATLGIWIAQLRLPVAWVLAPEQFCYYGYEECCELDDDGQQDTRIVYGHSLTMEQMQTCYEKRVVNATLEYPPVFDTLLPQFAKLNHFGPELTSGRTEAYQWSPAP